MIYIIIRCSYFIVQHLKRPYGLTKPIQQFLFHGPSSAKQTAVRPTEINTPPDSNFEQITEQAERNSCQGMLYNAGSPDEWLHSESDKRKTHRWNVPLAGKVSRNEHIRLNKNNRNVCCGYWSERCALQESACT